MKPLPIPRYYSTMTSSLSGFKVLISVICLLFCFSGCKKFLDRTPQTSVSPNNYFNSESDLQQYVNSFYYMLPDGGDIYQADNESDNVDPATIPTIMTSAQIVPSNASSAGWTWTDLRNVNYFLEHYRKAAISDSIKNNYAGIARFFRAYFYFEKLQTFGDIPWYSSTLTDTTEELYKPRDSRSLIVDSILSDLDFAINNIKTSKTGVYITKWAALGLKSRICLFEGTYRKYHTELNLTSTAPLLLQKSVEAAQIIMNSGLFYLYTTGTSTSDYGHLFTMATLDKGEIILGREYSADYNVKHFANSLFNTATLGAPGLTKGLMDNYVMLDGTPFSSTKDWNSLTFNEEVKGRDPRMSQTVRTPGYTRIGSTTLLTPDFTCALTGYQCIKFVSGPSEDGYYQNTNALPIIRYAEILLNFAEAKAELGQLNQSAIDISINLIRKRAGVSSLSSSNLQSDPVLLSQYSQTSDPLILAVRRERRVELAMEGFRRQDMLRWKEGKMLANNFYGMYFKGFGYQDFNGDGKNDFGLFASTSDVPGGTITGVQYLYLSSGSVLSNGSNGNLNIHPKQHRQFIEPRDYLHPLPTNEITLNPSLSQNPGW